MKEIKEFRIIGLALKTKTTNSNGQSASDCGALWQKFGSLGIADKIPEKLSEEIFAVYYNYEADYTGPFSYFIGCKTGKNTPVPDGMDSLIITASKYKRLIAKGKIPECIARTWTKIWSSDIPRAYKFDFEVYGSKSKDWDNAEIEIFVSVK